MSRAARTIAGALCALSLLAVPGNANDAPYYFALARMYAAEGAFERAANAFSKAIELEPNDSYLRLEHAEFLSRRGLLRQAIREVQLALELNEANLEALRLFGYLHLELAPSDSRSVRTAREAFERLRESEPDDVASMLTLSRIYVQIGESEKAFDVLEEAFGHAPDHPAVHSRLLEAATWSKDRERVKIVLESLLARNPASLETRLAMARLLIDEGNHQSAIEVLASAPEADESDGQVEYLLARELFRQATRRDLSWSRRQVSLAGAREAVERLLEVHPEHFEGRYLEALVLSAGNENEAAIEGLIALRAQAPAALEPRLVGKLAELLDHQGRPEEAAKLLADLAESLGASADNPGAGSRVWLEVARLHAREGQWDALAEVATRLQASNDAVLSMEGFLLGAEAELQLQRYNSALRLLESIAEGDPRPVLKRAEVYFAAGRQDQGEATLEELVESGELEGLLAVAQFRLGRQEFEEVLPVLEKSLKESSGDDAGLQRELTLLLAESLGEVGRPEKGLRVLEQHASGFDGATVAESVRLGLTRAQLLEAADRPEQAAELYAQLESDADPTTVLMIVQSYQGSERFVAMVPLLETAISKLELEESDSVLKVDLFFALGMAHERLASLDASEAAFRQVLELNPDDGRTLNYLGYTWAEQGKNLEEALELIERAVSLEPRNGAYLDSLGWVYFQLARYEDARSPLESAAMLVPDDPTILEHMGDVYLALKKPKRARELYRRAMDVGVEDVDGLRQKLALLETDDS